MGVSKYTLLTITAISGLIIGNLDLVALSFGARYLENSDDQSARSQYSATEWIIRAALFLMTHV